MSARRSRKAAAGLVVLTMVAAVPTACGDVTSDLIAREGLGDGGSAVACVNDADCPAGTPRCDPGRERCVECMASSDCLDTEVCSLPAATCTARCTDSSRCPLSSPVCDETTGLCRRCGGDLECLPGRPYCNSSSGRCDECRAEPLGGPSLDCTTFDRPFCEQGGGSCVECLTDGHCGGTEDCSEILGVCAVPCGDAGCPEDDPICDRALGFCVECLDDRDCEPETPYCSNSECTR